MGETIKSLANSAFILTTDIVSVIVVSACLIVFTGIWISYCSSVVYQLKHHVNAVTLRKLEKFFRDNGDTNKLVEILVRPKNDVAMVFYVCCRADIPHDKISEHLNYKSFKYINKKIKPRAYGLFFLLSCVTFIIASLAFGFNINAIDWSSPLPQLIIAAVFFIQIITVSVIFFMTQYRVNACWQEFINLFMSMQKYAHEFWMRHEAHYPVFSKLLIDAIQSTKRVNSRVENLISRCVKTGTYMRKINNTTFTAKEEKSNVNVTTPMPKYQTLGPIGPISDSDKMMDRMMNLMQQSMQHNQFMNQQMQQAQMMQYNQMLQPGLQQHTMQNQIMMQNAQVQNLINQRFAVAATASVSEPPAHRPPMPSYEYDPKRLPLSMQRSHAAAHEHTEPQDANEIKATGTEELSLGKLEPFDAAPVITDVPQAEAAAQVPAMPPKNPGKEISQKPFELLNKEFKNKHKELYVDKRFQAPVVFLRPDRDATRIEERLESIFHAKVIKYLPGEWEQIRPSSE